MLVLSVILYLIAAVCFGLTALGLTALGLAELVALGLLAWVLVPLLGTWSRA